MNAHLDLVAERMLFPSTVLCSWNLPQYRGLFATGCIGMHYYLHRGKIIMRLNYYR